MFPSIDTNHFCFNSTIVLSSLFHSFWFSLLTLMYFVFQVTVRRGLETSLVESKEKYKVAHWIQEIARSVVSFKLSETPTLHCERMMSWLMIISRHESTF